jgi:DNA-binding winged helix-turn-helix (wHTH) protein
MVAERQLTFGSFRLDLAQGRLWRGAQVIDLRPRSLAVLRYLVEHPGRLVPKAELRQHVWGGTYVSDTVLRVCVQEIRAALGDAAAAPQYLETVGRQGYRFLGRADRERPAPFTTDAASPIVGRQAEVAALERWFQQAAHGAHQVVFVSGEAGVGKTTVVEVWQARQGVGSGRRLAWGQCVEHYGVGEPYLPILQALGQLCRGPSPQEVLAVVRQYAPLWLAQLPGLVSEPERERRQRQVQGAPAARMLWELTEALAVLSAEAPPVLVLEDLQWSDHATVEALAAVAQQRSQEALALAQQTGHTPSLAFATIFAAIFSQFRRDVAATHTRANALITDAPTQGFVYRVDQGNLLRGWALAMQEDAAAGIALIRQGLALQRHLYLT